MELSNILTQQFTTIGNVLINKHIHFEDRMISAAINVVCTAVIGICINIFINILFNNKYEEYKKKIIKWYNPTKESPLDFDPDDALIHDDTLFLYKSRYKVDYIFKLWFYMNHIEKDYTKYSDNKYISWIPSKQDIENALHGKAPFNYDIQFKRFPIWKKNRKYVYAKDDFYGIIMESNSSTELFAVTEALDELRKTVEKNTNMQYNSDGCKLWYFKKGNETNTKFRMEALGSIDKKHTFDYLHFQQKSEILPLLEKFKNGILYPPYIPMENKMGILLHGPPGTGKTRFISAAANYLGRDVALINFAKVQTCEEFDLVIKEVLQKRLILVLDEIDTMKGVLTREGEGSEKEKSSTIDINPYMMMLLAKEKESDGLMQGQMKRLTSLKDDELTLGYILSKLDGLESCKDLMVIATTNHPERIDPALKRPGRFGFELHLGKCTYTMLCDILYMLFPETDMDTIMEEANKLPINYYTPAYIIQYAIQYSTFEKTIHILKTEKYYEQLSI